MCLTLFCPQIFDASCRSASSSYVAIIPSKKFVVRALPGKRIFALNVMWKYLGLRSFPVSEEEYMKHLDNVAASLKAIRQVSAVHQFIKKRRDKPRLGTAVSIPLTVPLAIERELFPNDENLMD